MAELHRWQGKSDKLPQFVSSRYIYLHHACGQDRPIALFNLCGKIIFNKGINEQRRRREMNLIEYAYMLGMSTYNQINNISDGKTRSMRLGDIFIIILMPT